MTSFPVLKPRSTSDPLQLPPPCSASSDSTHNPLTFTTGA